jgi:hypothetical protein
MRQMLIRVSVLAAIPAAAATLAPSLMAGPLSSDPAAPYLGMTKEQIIACAGEPHSKLKMGPDRETLTYHYSGAGPVPDPSEKSEEKKKAKPSFFGDKKDKKKDKDWTCSASLVFENGRLARVSFAHKEVRSPYAWQSEKNPKKREELLKPVPTCTFSLPRCAAAQ